MTEVRQVPTATDLLAGVREGVEEIVRDALAETGRLREEADEALARYDETVHEMTSLRSEIFGLRRDRDEIPERINRARLDAMVDDSHGEDPEDLQRRYVVCRERLPVAEARLSRLGLALLGSGSRPAKVSPEGGARRLVKHTAREPILDGLNEIVQSLERLRDQLPDVVTDATAELLKERQAMLDGQAMLWGLSKART